MDGRLAARLGGLRGNLVQPQEGIPDLLGLGALGTILAKAYAKRAYEERLSIRKAVLLRIKHREVVKSGGHEWVIEPKASTSDCAETANSEKMGVNSKENLDISDV
jgi:hypothetical protein